MAEVSPNPEAKQLVGGERDGETVMVPFDIKFFTWHGADYTVTGPRLAVLNAIVDSDALRRHQRGVG